MNPNSIGDNCPKENLADTISIMVPYRRPSNTLAGRLDARHLIGTIDEPCKKCRHPTIHQPSCRNIFAPMLFLHGRIEGAEKGSRVRRRRSVAFANEPVIMDASFAFPVPVGVRQSGRKFCGYSPKDGSDRQVVLQKRRVAFRMQSDDSFDAFSDARVTLALHGALLQAMAGATGSVLQEAASIASLPFTALLPEGETPDVSAAHHLGDADSVFVPTVPQHIRVHAKVVRGPARTANGYDALLLHGLLGSAFCFRSVLAPIAHLLGGTAAAFDRPPFGLSEPTAATDFTLAGEASLTTSVARSLRLRAGRVVLIGHSMGGAVALRAALDTAPAALVLLAPALQVPYPAPMRAAARLALAHPPLGRSMVRRRMRDVARVAAEDPRMPSEVHAGYALPMRREDWDEGMRAYLRSFQGFDVWEWRDELARLDVPVLVIAADRDAVVSDTALKRLCETLPRATLARLDGVSHLMFEDDPDALVGVVQRWAERELGV